MLTKKFRTIDRRGDCRKDNMVEQRKEREREREREETREKEQFSAADRDARLNDLEWSIEKSEVDVTGCYSLINPAALQLYEPRPALPSLRNNAGN